MKTKKIDQIRDLLTSNKTFTPDEIQWLKDNNINPANQKFAVLAPKYIPGGQEHVTEHDREMAKRIKSKIPGMVIVELSKHDTKL